MIYRFIAARTITACIAVEASSLDEAKRRVIARALAGFENTDFPHREDEHIHVRGVFETWEGANAAGVDLVVEEDAILEGGLELLALFEQELSLDEVQSSYRKAIQEENPVAYYPLDETSVEA